MRINEIKQLLHSGFISNKIHMGTFGAYLISDLENQALAVFKPIRFQPDEAIKELLAYMLDHEGFANVPETELMCIYHPDWGLKKGALQVFSPGRSLGIGNPKLLRSSYVRKMALLDIRLMNMDRHTGNFLLHEKKIIPIDHHLVLPAHLETCFFAWSDWEQAKTPFSEEEKEYIACLNPAKDREMILNGGLPVASANLCFAVTYLLKYGSACGLTAEDFSCFLEKRKKHPAYDLWKNQMLSLNYQNEGLETFRKGLDHFLDQMDFQQILNIRA